MRRVIILLLGLVGGLAFCLAAQAPVALGPGQRVRLQTTSSSSWVIGTILAVGADSIHLRLSDTTSQLSVKRGAIARLEISRGMKSSAGKGARTGLLIGGALGALVFAPGSDQSGYCCPTGVKVVLFGVTAGLGAFVGWIVGGSSLHERWDRVSLGEGRVTLMPRRAGLMLSVRL